MPIIEVKNISKKYVIGHQKTRYNSLRDDLTSAVKKPIDWVRGTRNQKEEFWALKDINFSVEKGEVLGIIGANGAGKSTLLKILSRITPPTEGMIKMQGRVGSLLEVGTGFHPELTGRENIYLNGAILGMKRKEIAKKFDEIVEFAGIEKFLDTPVKHYSSGMHVRLAFSVAAHLEPDILIVDEVLAVGDAEFQKKSLGKMEEITKKDGRTILFVSHNMAAVKSLCSKAILLDGGKIIMEGSVQDVVNKYSSSIGINSKIDLLKIKHNNRHQEFGILSMLSIYDSNYNPCSTFSMGDSVIFKISVHCKKYLKNAEVGVKISSSLGVAIHYFTSIWEGLRVDLDPGDYVFEVVIPQILLLPGKYIIGAWLLKEGYPSDDSVQDITMIEIISSDITGYSANFNKYAYNGGEVYALSKWKLINSKI